jgi:protein-tyrosine phosphatase
LFHCHAGKDRTGLIAALLLALAGVPEPTIAEDYALSQECLQPIYDERLSQERDPAQRARLARMFGSVPETMLGILEHLNTRHDGAERYLLAAGVAPADVERLRRRVRE